MTLELVLPEMGKEITTKDAVFSILAEGEPRTATQLQRELRRRYKKSVSFQAVLKAVRTLQESRVLVKEKKTYFLNKDWIFETRQYLDRLYTEHFKVAKPIKKVEMGKDITIYTVSNLLELDRLWNDLLTTWAKQETANKTNVCKGRHCFWLLLRLQEEDILHDLMLQKGVITYNVITSNTPLDKQAGKYYAHKGEHTKISLNKDSEDKYLAAFGNFVLKFNIPENINKELEKIYQKTKKPQDLDLKKATDIFKETVSIEVTVIKDEMLARQVQKEIISRF
ncbi:MAG: hypothetical protein AABY00_00825 [Nanoarchaeota archaeon]